MKNSPSQLQPFEKLQWLISDAISRYPGAELAFNRLCANGIPTNELMKALTVYSVMTGLHPILHKKRRKWLQDKASRRRTYRRTSLALSHLADEIERINSDFLPAVARPVPSPRLIEAARAQQRFGSLEERFKALPSTLRLYARFLQSKSRLRTGREDSPLKPVAYLRKFIQSRYRRGSRYFWSDFATLATAMNSAAGMQDDEVAPFTLRRQIYPRKTSPRS